MGRPPGTSSINSPSRLTPFHGSSRSAKFRQFVVPIPPTPIALAKAIRSLSRRRPPQQQRLRALTSKHRDQLVKIENNRHRLKQVEEEKERALRQVRVDHLTSTAAAVKALTTRVRAQQEKDTATARQEFSAQLQTECQEKEKEWQQESVGNAEATTAPIRKRLAWLQKAAQKDKGDGDTTMKPEQTEESQYMASICQPAMDAVEIKSDTIKSAQTQKEASLEKLHESRSELIWLLKQVIKAEEKHKAKKKAAA